MDYGAVTNVGMEKGLITSNGGAPQSEEESTDWKTFGK